MNRTKQFILALCCCSFFLMGCSEEATEPLGPTYNQIGMVNANIMTRTDATSAFNKVFEASLDPIEETDFSLESRAMKTLVAHDSEMMKALGWITETVGKSVPSGGSIPDYSNILIQNLLSPYFNGVYEWTGTELISVEGDKEMYYETATAIIRIKDGGHTYEFNIVPFPIYIEQNIPGVEEPIKIPNEVVMEVYTDGELVGSLYNYIPFYNIKPLNLVYSTEINGMLSHTRLVLNRTITNDTYASDCSITVNNQSAPWIKLSLNGSGTDDLSKGIVDLNQQTINLNEGRISLSVSNSMNVELRGDVFNSQRVSYADGSKTEAQAKAEIEKIIKEKGDKMIGAVYFNGDTDCVPLKEVARNNVLRKEYTIGYMLQFADGSTCNTEDFFTQENFPEFFDHMHSLIAELGLEDVVNSLKTNGLTGYLGGRLFW